MSYRRVNQDGGFLGAYDSLYEAARACVGKLGDYVVSKDGQLIAFWCGHERRVRPGFGASPQERALISEDSGLLSL